MKNIDKILNEAKNQNTPEFPFSNEEIRNFIKVDDNGEIPSNPKYKGIIKMTIVSSAITAIVALFMLLSNSNENPVHTVSKIESAKSAIENVQNSITNPIKSSSDSENNLLAYVYLKNKTFLNAHLLKKGLADVDLSVEFGLKNKFLSIAQI